MFPTSAHTQENNTSSSSHMNVENESPSSSYMNNENESSSSSFNDVRQSSRLRNAQNQHYYGLNVTNNALFEPSTYRQAIACEQSRQWKNAIDDELSSLVHNQTWTKVKRTHEMNIIDTRWVFKIKKNPDGSIGRYKARLVAKGYNQQYGIDYNETFAPTLKYKSLRTLLALSMHMQHKLYQLDVKTAFLHAQVHEDIYISIPDGMNDEHDCVLKLRRALYGLKQASREWHNDINKYLMSLGWAATQKDPCLYIKKTSTNNLMLLGLFVDDISASVHPNDYVEWEYTKYMLKIKYDITDMGELNHVLGMTITQNTNKNESKMNISQSSFMNDKLTEFNFKQSRTTTTPEEIQSQKQMNDSSSPLDAQNQTQYRNIVGSLMYASLTTRPDITHAVNVLSRSNSNPSEASMIKAKRVLRYLSGTPTKGLTYTHAHTHMNIVVVSAYSDADWGGDLVDRKSTTGYAVMINDNLVSWNSKKQQTVALSSAESEYMAVSEVMKELLWLRALLNEIGVPLATPSIIYVDNQAAIQISKNDTHHDRTKHIDIRHHFIRDCIRNNDVDLQWIETKQQRADIFTKALGTKPFTHLRTLIMKQ
jgi:hypothetical protein